MVAMQCDAGQRGGGQSECSGKGEGHCGHRPTLLIENLTSLVSFGSNVCFRKTFCTP